MAGITETNAVKIKDTVSACRHYSQIQFTFPEITIRIPSSSSSSTTSSPTPSLFSF
jgi:hypothetical protein